MWSLFMWAIVRDLETGSMMLGVWGVGSVTGPGWVIGVPDRERAWAAAEERVVTMMAIYTEYELEVRSGRITRVVVVVLVVLMMRDGRWCDA